MWIFSIAVVSPLENEDIFSFNILVLRWPDSLKLDLEVRRGCNLLKIIDNFYYFFFIVSSQLK